MQLKNRVIIAAAGSGKTTFITNDACSQKGKVIILTYTVDNYNEIRKKIIECNGVIPKNIKIQTWFSFLLSEGVRPYQSYLYDKKRINNICFVSGKSTRYIKKDDVEKYFFRNGDEIFTDKISEFVLECNKKSNYLVVKRMEKIFDSIYVDEIQDLAGYDLDILKLLFLSKINIILVGDIRQATYSTNSSPKNKKYSGSNIYNYFKLLEKNKLCKLIDRNYSYRCNQQICDFADSLYPNLEKTNSKNKKVTGHDGIFIVSKKELSSYIKKYSPQILRYDKRTKFNKEGILNFGQSKGLTFDRILILPNSKIKEFLNSGDYSNLEKSKSKIYVAITRARYSVAILYDKECCKDLIKKFDIKIL